MVAVGVEEDELAGLVQGPQAYPVLEVDRRLSRKKFPSCMMRYRVIYHLMTGNWHTSEAESPHPGQGSRTQSAASPSGAPPCRC